MRKFMVRAIPAATLILFILVMQSDIIYKKYFDNGSMTDTINLIIQDIEGDKWIEADAKTKQLSESWKSAVRVIQYSAELDEIRLLDKNISRLKGAVMAKDKANAFIELNEALEHWENIDE